MQNDFALTSILNTTEHTVKIENIEISIDPLHDKDNDTLTNNNIFLTTSSSTYNSKRLQTISNLLRVDHLNSEEKFSLISLCHEFNDSFYIEGDNLTCTDVITHEIPTTSSIPISSKLYRYPQVFKEEVDNQISKMLQQEIIQPSTSPWNSPVWVVPKKQDASGKKKFRIVIDYRKLNEITIGDSFPIPNITDILDQLGHSNYFSTIDLPSGCHQIKMSSKDAEKTAFSTPTGHYQFNRMPFGLKNAPATFQRLMNTVLSGIQNSQCFVYLDDIVVFADNLENHNKKLKQVFKKLSEHNLKIQPDKCEFLRREVMYLGHLITENGVKPDPKKVSAVRNYPIPKQQKDIKAFLGLAGYYRRFIKNFSTIAIPLTKLLRKDAIFTWTNLQQEAFDKFKDILCSEPLLQYPDFTQKFYLTTDASNFAIGSVLSQGNPPHDLPIAYASRTLNKAETNYSTTDKELLAIIWSIKHFRPYLYGKKFTIITDHKPLTWLYNLKDPSSRRFRWRLSLEEYDFDILYKKGKLNNNADSLSRIPINTDNDNSKQNSNDPLINDTDEFTDLFPEYNPFQINMLNSSNNESYEKFLESSKSKLISYDKLEEYNSSLCDNNKIILMCISTDRELTERYQKDIQGNFDILTKIKDKELNLNEIIQIEVRNKTFLILNYKQHFWETIRYEDIFNSIMELKTYLIKNKINQINMPKLGNSYDKLKWSKIRMILRFIFKQTQITINIHHNTLIEPNLNEINQIIKDNHSNPSSGHSGFHRTYTRIKQNYKWKNMKKDVKKFIKQCKSCSKNKLDRFKTKQAMEITTTSSKPFEKIFMDVVGPLTLTERGNKFIITLQDDLTKFSKAFAVPNHEAETIARKLVENFICTFGVPQIIVTDQGRDFTSDLLKNISKLFKIKQIKCSAYHPQSNGALERSHLTLADYLKHYINDSQSDWDDWIEFAMFSYNTSVHTSTKFTPFELIFANKPNLPNSITKNPEFKYTYNDYLDEITLKLNKSHQLARNHLLHSKEINKQHYDKHINPINFNIGDLVYILNEQTKQGKSKKLSPRYNGPYKIIDVNIPNCTLIERKLSYMPID